MRAPVAAIERFCSQGLLSQAQALASSHHAAHGPDPEGAKALARAAGKARDPRLLSLACALWPQALGSKARELLLGIAPSAAVACAAMSPELSRALDELARQRERPAEPKPAPRSPIPAPKRTQRPPPAIIVRARARVKIRRG